MSNENIQQDEQTSLLANRNSFFSSVSNCSNVAADNIRANACLIGMGTVGTCVGAGSAGIGVGLCSAPIWGTIALNLFAPALCSLFGSQMDAHAYTQRGNNGPQPLAMQFGLDCRP